MCVGAVRCWCRGDEDVGRERCEKTEDILGGGQVRCGWEE